MAEVGTYQHTLSIKPFDGTDFNGWETNLMLILEQHSLLGVVCDSPPNVKTDPGKAAEFNQNDIRARFIITQAIADHMQVFLKDQKTAKGMLESLRRDFGNDSIESVETPSMHVWSDDETKRLLNFYRHLVPQLRAGKISTKEKMMAMIEKRMGGQMTAAQCYNRIKCLERSYKLHKNGRGGKNFSFKYADVMEAIKKGTDVNSAIWLDLNVKPDSMDANCEPDNTDEVEPSNIHVWTDDETKRLLGFYCQLLPELDSGNIPTKDKMMAIIEKKMKGKVTAAQCKNRIKGLQRSYRLFKNGQGRRSIRGKYADIMEAIENGTHDNSGTWCDLNEEPESMEFECDPEDSNVSAPEQINESTTWSEEETARLLELYKQLKPELVVGSIPSQEKAMEIIAQDMNGHFTPTQCLDHFNDLSAAYTSYKKDPVRNKFKLAEAMKAIEGEDSGHSMDDESNDESHEVLIVGDPMDMLSENDSNDRQTSAAVEVIIGNNEGSQNDESGDEGNKEENRTYMVWTRSKTIKFLSFVENFAGKVGTPQVKSRARMWALVARRMGKSVSAEQCCNKWKTLEKSYKKAVAEGRVNQHPYLALMKAVHKRLNQALLPYGSNPSTTYSVGSKLVLPSPHSFVSVHLESGNNSRDGDTTDVGQDEISSSPRPREVSSLFPNEIDDPEGDQMWSRKSTLKLIKLYKDLKGHVGTSTMRTHKKLWQTIALNIGRNFNANQCENRWRELEQKYRKHLNISSTLSLKGKSIKAFEYFSQIDAIFNLSPDSPTNPSSEFSGIHLTSSSMSAPRFLAASSFEGTLKNNSEDLEEDLNNGNERIPYKLRLLERMRRDKKEYYSQMVSIQRERLDIEQERLEQLKRKNRLIERSLSLPKKT